MIRRAKQLLSSIFPPARKPVTLRSALPLLIFLLLYGAICALLEFRDILLFAYPRAFVLMLVTPWIWWAHLAGRTGFSGARSTITLGVRLALCGVFVMLLAEPRAVRKSDVLSLVYVVDLSDSMGETATESALTYAVRTAAEKPEKDQAGLVVFGRDAAVELPPRVSFPFEAINTRVARDATDLSKSLSVAAAILPEEHQGRIVLISDGTETMGSLSRVLDELKSRNIAVDVLPVEYAYAHEVWLERLELPRRVKSNETYNAAVILNSRQAGSGRLILRENGKQIHQRQISWQAGKKRIVLPIYLREPGYYEYIATIEVPRGKDGWKENNIAINYLFLRGKGKVLLVTDPEGQPLDVTALATALRQAKRSVELRSAYAMPRDAMSLLPYDCIVFVNVPREMLDQVQLQAVHDAVYNQGVGFLMVGGKNSFGPGGWHRSVIEQILPVKMDISTKKVMPKGALVIVLHTCEFPQGNTWGKRITKQAIRVLSAQDEVGVLIYDFNGADRWLFDLTPAGDLKKLHPLINKAQIGDMPAFTPTMTLGLASLKKSDAAAKHMIIITDGDPSPPPGKLLAAFRAANISISTVSVFPHGGQDIQIMKLIARATGGRYYSVKNANRLPSIFIKEAKTLRRSLIQNKLFTPRVAGPSAVLNGLGKLPPLRGYVLTSPKPRSEMILQGPETEEADPLLISWHYGLGKTAAFTSDLGSNWGRDWVSWAQYRAFVSQLIVDISRVERPTHLQTHVSAQGNRGVVLIEDHYSQPTLLDIQAAVSGPRNRRVKVKLKQIGLRRYRGTFALWGKGRYQLMAMAKGGGRTEHTLGGIVIPYSPEYLRFRSSPIMLERIAEKTGGRLLAGKETGKTLFKRDDKPRRSSRSVAVYFLLLLACLVPLDVGVRRIQLDRSVLLGWFGLGRKRSTETLSALLARKQQITFQSAQTDRPLPAAPPPRTGSPQPGAPPPQVKQDRPVADNQTEEPLSTTAQLLAMKRKRAQQENETHE